MVAGGDTLEFRFSSILMGTGTGFSSFAVEVVVGVMDE